MSQRLSAQESIIESPSSKISRLKEIILLILQIVDSSVFSLEDKVNELYDDGDDSESTDNESSYKECNYGEEYISSTTFAVGRLSRRQN